MKNLCVSLTSLPRLHYKALLKFTKLSKLSCNPVSLFVVIREIRGWLNESCFVCCHELLCWAVALFRGIFSQLNPDQGQSCRCCSVVSWAETAPLCASCSPQSISVTSSALAPNPSDVEGPRVGNQLIWNKIKPTHLPKESIEIVGKELEICESEGWAAHNTDRCLPKLCRIFKLLPAKIQVQRWSLPHLTSSAVSCLVLH